MLEKLLKISSRGLWSLLNLMFKGFSSTMLEKHLKIRSQGSLGLPGAPQKDANLFKKDVNLFKKDANLFQNDANLFKIHFPLLLIVGEPPRR